VNEGKRSLSDEMAVSFFPKYDWDFATEPEQALGFGPFEKSRPNGLMSEFEGRPD
jgi:hypothetical protein